MLNFSNTSTIYVSQESGKSYYSGFYKTPDFMGNGPLESIEHALQKVYELRVSGSSQPLTICILDEEYFLDAPIDLKYDTLSCRFRDNNSIRDITFEPYGDADCKIIGGKKIEGFQYDTFNGKKCLSAFIPEVQNGTMRFTDLYVDGKRAKLTRYPKEGTLRCVETENVEGSQNTSSKWFIAKKEDLNHLSNIEDSIISYYHFWIDEHTPVESYDRETGKLVMKYMSRFWITNKYDDEQNTANFYYYVENIPECFENPGEWYLENKTGMLYYIPEDETQTPESITVYAPTQSALLNIIGTLEERVCNIRFKNISFCCSKGDYASKSITPGGLKEGEAEECFGSDAQSVANAPGAINIRYASNCSFDGCTFTNLGIHGISIEVASDGMVIENSTFYDMGAGAVRIFGPGYGEAPELDTHHHAVRNCSISYCGRRYAAGCGILACHTYSNEFCDNEISYLDYSGISVGWVWGFQNTNTHDNIMKRNHIHHIGTGNLSDMGGIYLLGKQKGAVIADNHIHDVICKHYGGWGIYTDEGSSYVIIENNLVYNCSSNCYHQHYGSYNVVKNNIFAHGGEAVVRCSVPEMHMCMLLERNILITDGQPIYNTAEQENNGFNPGLVSHSNVVFDTTKAMPDMFEVEGKRIPFDVAQKYGVDIDSVVEDPKLDESYILDESSPAFRFGFKKLSAFKKSE